ncbi:flagellar motor switch protein G [Acetobacter estunensis NRIC 0472]|uniref:Flagellar motor switch protein FliG n=1 Tax=Acetobacter estunensis TaxID=104097 RepID=A0A967EED4_9PROT|nr:flagellar motor switch protein FliG [Acetobacter estunensis]MBV1836138.1 flagellar motor switch protein FliG [Acetobacter estunensis]NHO54940.1 flagellar motor switch protein FliG [Acetobacter estunensis]GBQ26994.1 flagellar motor switch protein G [Acetobacter estunensis NRIC 0472]
MLTKTDISGAQKAAILLLALGEESGTQLFSMMQEAEIREVSAAMATIGMIPAETVESVCNEFSKSFASSDTLIGSYESTERLLRKALPPDRANLIMEEIRGPAGRTMWDKLGNVPETVLANYLRNEYPQTVAVILSRLQPAQAARVLALLPEDFAVDVMMRMLHMENVQRDVIDSLETTLRSEFIASLARTSQRDSHELLAEIFNNFDRRIEGQFMNALEKRNFEDAERVKALMFTFEDIQRLSPEVIMRVMRDINREKLPLALKGASEELRNLFLSSMTARAGKILQDEITSLGPVRIKDVDAAQAEIVSTIKELANQGEIDINPGTDSNELLP